MTLVNWWLLLLAISPIEGSLGLWKPKSSSAEERVTKQILETCYGDNDFEDLIFILGDFNESIAKTSVIRLKNLLNVDEDYESHQYLNIGVTKVIIIADSFEKLNSDLRSFKKTRWWNHMPPFFIIVKNDEKCGNFEVILNIIWRMEILNPIYICSQSENTTLYTLNPITNYAPHPWRRVKDFSYSNIYHQIFNPHISCNNLNYDKTKVLNGYRIRAILPDVFPSMAMDQIISEFHEKPDSRLFHRVIEQLNASVTYQCVNHGIDLQYHFDELRSGDIIYAEWSTRWNYLQPIRFIPIQRTASVVLVKSNERTILQKIRHLWSTRVLCAATIALIILFFILVMKNGEVTSAMLDIIRFLTYLSIQTDTRSNAFRIYFTTMLIFIVISNGVFQGKIASFLTNPEKVPPIETIEELKELGYHFYMPGWWQEELQLELESFKSGVNLTHSDDECIDSVLNNPLNACIIPLRWYQEKHLLQPVDCVKLQDDIPYLPTWKSRRNWPLYERFNRMLMQFIESHNYEDWRREAAYVMKHKRKADDYELALAEIVSPYRPIKLVNLDFAFKLLAIGLLLATFVLIIELRMREIGTN